MRTDLQVQNRKGPLGAPVDATLVMLTLWLFNIAMENGPFIDDFRIQTTIYSGFSMAMLNNQMVTVTSTSSHIHAGHWHETHFRRIIMDMKNLYN